jgi:site-specific recombinase XerD
LTLADLDAPLVLAFLDYLEKERRNCPRSRNARFAAIRSFVKYAAVRDPECLPMVQRVLAIPMKRFERPLVGFLTRDEMRALLEAPESTSWSGQRDRVLVATLYNTGARVSELVGMTVTDVSLERSLSVRIRGKGRKERTVPLWNDTASRIREWLKRTGAGPEEPLFPNHKGKPLTRSGVESRLRKASRSAAQRLPSLKGRRVSPHIIRHTTAMHMLQSGVDLSVIALWLGHESPSTTHMYVEADLSMKQQALGKLQEPSTKRLRYRPADPVLQFLESL